MTAEALASAPRRLSTAREFLSTEAGGAVVLLIAALAALVWANSPWSDSYTALWETDLSITVGSYVLGGDLGHFISDGLMTFFFLLVGLELRRELDLGEFRDRRRIAVPVIAAVGGMVLPVIIFLSLNAGTEAARGWAMVMATDTAFAVGVLALVGRRSSVRLRIFLLTLVIVDDIAAVGVIALFYSSNLQTLLLLVGVALLGVMAWLRSRGVEAPLVYLVLGFAIWLAAFEGGVHPTVAGVAMGLVTGAYAPRRATLQRAIGLTRAFRQQPSPALASAAASRITSALSPNDRLQHAIHPWSSYVIVPLFALANAGVDLSGDLVGRVLGSRLVIGIVLGLVVGKTVGIPIGAWLATRRRLGGAPLSIGWPQLVAASAVAGIGFTVSLLIADLSYTDELLEDAKIGILLASGLAAALSVAMFYGLSRLPAERLRRAEARAARPLTDLQVPVDEARDHIRGPLNAPVTLLEYGDYECPLCGRAEALVKEMLERENGDVRFVFRHLPLPEIHPRAPLAAEAAEAAGAQGKFWEMHDRLFANQDALLPRDLSHYAAELGLDVARFEADLRANTFANRIDEDIDSADATGAVGTPTFFVNGVLYRGKPNVDGLEAFVRRPAAMAEARREPKEELDENESR